MNTEAVHTRQVVLDAIRKIAPDVGVASLPDDVDFRDEAELDSIDFLGVLNTVRDVTGVEVPEADYQQIITVAGFAHYLADRVADRAGA
jgi:acyl carrier protein